MFRGSDHFPHETRFEVQHLVAVEASMTPPTELPEGFLPDVLLLLRECGPDPDMSPQEIEAIARVAQRVEGWLHLLAPDGLPVCEEWHCVLPATDPPSRGGVCTFHARHG